MNETAATPQRTTDYLGLARSAFTASTTFFDSSIRPQAEAGIRQFQGVHPSGSKYHSDAYKSRSRLFRPKTRTAIRKNEAIAAEAFFSTNDVVSITAEDDSNPLQQASAEVMLRLMNYRLKKSIPWFQIEQAAYQEAQAVGVAIAHTCWQFDAKRGLDRPTIELIPIENLRIDPGASWVDPVNTSPYVIRLMPMYVKDVKARAQVQDSTTSKGRWLTVSDTQLLQATQAYSDTTRQARERGRTDSKEPNTGITDFTIVWVHQNVMEIDGQDMVWYSLGTTAMLSNPVPIEQVWRHAQPGNRPFVIGNCVIEAHKIYPDGVTGLTKDTQAEINEIANQRIDNVKFAMNKRYFVARNRQVDLRSLTRNVPGSATMLIDPEKDVKIIDTPDVTSSAYQEQDRLNLDFDDVAGSFSQGSVQSNRKLNETVGGLNLLSTNANQVSTYQLRTFVETFVEPVLRQVMLMEQHYETDQVILALAGNAAKLQRFGMDAVTDEMLAQELTLSVNVGTSSTNPLDQINTFMQAMNNLRSLLADRVLEGYGMDVQEVIKELFGKLGYRDGARFFSVEQEDPRLTNAKNLIEQLQQQLAQKVSPEMLAKQIEKMDAEITNLAAKAKDLDAAAFEKILRGMFSSGQIAQMLVAAPGMAPVQDEVLKDAGYKRPTPEGVDPNLPQLAAPIAGITQNSIKDPRTGIEFMPGAAGDTSPNTPAAPVGPASPEVGANQGIETMAADS